MTGGPRGSLANLKRVPMDANTYAEFLAEEREWDLRALASERFRRQLRLAHSLGLLDVLLAETTHQELRPASRSDAAAPLSAIDNRSSFAP